MKQSSIFVPLLLCVIFVSLVHAVPLGADGFLDIDQDPIPRIVDKDEVPWGVSNTNPVSERIHYVYDPPQSSRLRQSQSGSQLPRIRIGTTHILYGPFVGWGSLHNNLWQMYIEKNLTYTIGGVEYGIEVISYLDDQGPAARDKNTTAALVERLVLVDAVNVLVTSYAGNSLSVFISTAEKLGVPCINVGAFDFAFVNPALFNWTVSIMPDTKTIGFGCGEELVAAGARTFAIARPYTPTIDFFTTLIISQLNASGLTFTGDFLNVTDDMWEDPELLDPIFDEFKRINPDVAMFDFRQANNIIFIDRMRRNDYNPPAYYVWGTGSYPEVREALGWMSAGSLIQEAYSPYLNSSDPLWGGTTEYELAYRARWNTSTSFADATLAAALTVLDTALKHVLDLSVVSIREALFAANVSTVVGPLSFTNKAVNRDLYCLQNSFPNATSTDTVWPRSAVSWKQLVYPALISYPEGYFDQFRNRQDHRKRNILIAVFSTLGGLLFLFGVASLVIYILLKLKYHVLFFERNEATDNWET